MTKARADHRGFFAYHHDNPPPPFNPEADPRAKDRYRAVTSSMQDDRFYDNHTREECKAEWGRRYEQLLNEERGSAFKP